MAGGSQRNDSSNSSDTQPSDQAPLDQVVRSSAFAALVAFGLAVPILALRTEQSRDNTLILLQRWDWVLIACLLAFLGRFAVAYRTDTRARTLMITGTLLAVWGACSAYYHSGGTVSFAAVASLGLGALMFVAGMLVPAVDPAWLHNQVARVTLPAGFGTWLARGALLAAVAYPFVILALTGRSGAIKWIDNFGIQILIYVMFGWGLNIVVGLAGLLDLGYVAFYAVGAYAYALLAKHFGLSFWICLPLAGILAALWGVLLGFPVLRLRGDYLAIVTLAFGEIIRIVLINWTSVTGGGAGISRVPRPSFFGLPFDESDTGFAATFGFEYSSIHRTIFYFYLILGLALLTNWVTLRLRRLPVGRAWEALREDEIACRSLGINTTNTKLTAFAIGAGFGGLAGAFFAGGRLAFVSPESFTFMESAVILAIVVLGGMGSQFGVAIAALAMIGGTEILRELDFLKKFFGQDFDPTQYRMLLFGLAMVVLMIFKPRGLISTRTPTLALKESRAIDGAHVKEGHG